MSWRWPRGRSLREQAIAIAQVAVEAHTGRPPARAPHSPCHDLGRTPSFDPFDNSERHTPDVDFPGCEE